MIFVFDTMSHKNRIKFSFAHNHMCVAYISLISKEKVKSTIDTNKQLHWPHTLWAKISIAKTALNERMLL